MAFKRSQIIWSLWQVFAGPFRTETPLASIPKVFSRRITNLIELGAGVKPESRSGQKGIDQLYSIEDALEVGIGLDLMDSGVPQAEAAAFVVQFREQLGGLARILNPSPAPPVFLVIRPRLIDEAMRTFEEAPRWSLPFYEPQIFTDVKDVDEMARRLGGKDRKRIIIEVQDLFSALAHALETAPEIRRGRS